MNTYERARGRMSVHEVVCTRVVFVFLFSKVEHCVYSLPRGRVTFWCVKLHGAKNKSGCEVNRFQNKSVEKKNSAKRAVLKAIE